MSKVTQPQKELELSRVLDQALESWFGLEQSDIPIVLHKMGITSEYSQQIVEASGSSVSLKISSDGKDYELSINRGDMVSLHASWCLTKDGTQTYYSVDKVPEDIEVEEICAFDEKGNMILKDEEVDS